MAANPSPAVLNARYIAIRTAEAKGLTDRLLQAARDRTPGVRRLLVPMLYRYWYRERERGWELLATIGDDMLRFPGVPDTYATETFAEVSLAILNGCRGDRDQLNRLASIWRAQVERIFATPLARLLGRGVMLRLLARPVAGVLQRQPPYQPLNFRELRETFSRPDDFRRKWQAVLPCLENPRQGIDAIVELLSDRSLPFDLYLMLLCERALIYHGVKVDRSTTFAALEGLFRDGVPWFRQSVLYILFHMLGRSDSVTDDELDRYVATAEEFFTAGSWRIDTAVSRYNFASHLGWPELVIDRHRPGTAPRIVPPLLQRAVAADDKEQIAGLFAAIDSVAFAYRQAPLALKMLEQCLEVGGAALETRVLESLATVRLQDEPLVDAFLIEHRNLTRLRPQVEGIEPTIRGEDMPTLLDGLTVELILESDHFRGRVCDAFRRAAEARSVPQFLVQILEWMRNEFRQMTPSRGTPPGKREPGG
ncbi:MAG: hypothetical protein AB7P12_02945 [Alphaproteobacteria bacterium]